MREVLALRHVAFEDLGSFHGVLEAEGFSIRYVDPGLTDAGQMDALSPRIVAVLGGPIGAYQDKEYPFITREMAFIERRLAAGLPVLGICLGAQMIARALGAKVYPGPAAEIGWKPLRLSREAEGSPLAHLDGGLTNMMHWHGDTFDLPEGAERLASTDICLNQAFRKGKNCLAFQCHPELDYERVEPWLVGHAGELARHGLEPGAIRADSTAHGPKLKTQAAKCLGQWLREIEW